MHLSSNILTRLRFLYDSLVTVVVGSEETRFDLHKGLLCASSDFFKSAITGDFKERDQNEVKLPEQDVKIFKFFVHWLYTRRLRGFYYPETMKPSLQELRQAAIAELKIQHLDHLTDLLIDAPSGRALYLAHYRDAPFSHLVGLYILADTRLVHGLKDPIITLIIDVYCWDQVAKVGGYGPSPWTQHKEKGRDEAETLDWAPELQGTEAYTTPFWRYEPVPGFEDPCKGINMAWEALPRNSPLRRLTVECFCDNVVLVEKHTNGRQYHPGFLAAVAQNYAVRLYRVDSLCQVPDWDLKGQICKFHEHDGESECPFAKRHEFAYNPHSQA